MLSSIQLWPAHQSICIHHTINHLMAEKRIYRGICRICLLSQIFQTMFMVWFILPFFMYTVQLLYYSYHSCSSIQKKDPVSVFLTHKWSLQREFQHQTQTMSAWHDIGEQHDVWDSQCTQGVVCKCVCMRGGERGRKRGSTAVNQAERQAKRYATQWVHQYHVSVTPWDHIDCLSVPIWVRVQCASVRKW